MAVPSNTYQTYQSIGNREDLIDIIENISPVDTFVTSNTGSKRATAVLHEWQTDALAAAAASDPPRCEVIMNDVPLCRTSMMN